MKRKNMNFLKTFLTLTLATVLCFGTALPALAALDENGAAIGTEENPAQAGITKLLTMPDGTTTPGASFTFEFTKVSKNDETSSTAQDAMPTIENKTVTYETVDTGDTDAGIKSVYKETGDILSAISWPSAGVYVYQIREMGGTYSTNSAESMTYSDKIYQLSVYVKEKIDGGYYVFGVGAAPVLDQETGEIGPKIDPTPGDGTAGNHSQMIFTNSYLKTNAGGDPTNPDNQIVAISKAVGGDYAEKDRYFTYDLTVTKPAAVTGDITYKAYVLNGLNNIVTSSANTSDLIQTDAFGSYFTVTSDTSAEIKLKHDEKLVFTDVHIGATYEVTEQGTTNYIPSVIIVENGNTPVTLNGLLGSSLSTQTRTIGDQGVNTSDFINDYHQVTPTGIIIDNLPFILLLVVAAGALVLFVVAKVRKRWSYASR